MPGPPPPAVSVIVPAYGVAHLLGDALDSLIAQHFTDWEAIVIDDGAPDDVAGAVARYAGDPRIRLVQTDNGGISVARNRAIRHARADFIALLDGDDRYEPDYLGTMVAALRADPRLGFVTCDALFFGEGRIGRRFSEYAPQDEPITLARVLRREFNVFIASIIRLAAFDQAGGFDESIRWGEDLDLWIRLLELGWGARYVPGTLARYRRRAGSASSQTAAMRRSVIRIYRATADRLAGRAERQVALAMAEQSEREADWEEGESLILRGDAGAGLRLLRRSGAWRRSRAWAFALPLMSMVPPLARPILSWREKSNSDASNRPPAALDAAGKDDMP